MKLPHTKNSATSKEAARMKGSSAAGDELTVLRLIRKAKGKGLTCRELEGKTKMMHQSCSARIRGLVLKGLVCDSGKRRKTKAGYEQTVWVVGVESNLQIGEPQKKGKRPPLFVIRNALRTINVHGLAFNSKDVKALSAWLQTLRS